MSELISKKGLVRISPIKKQYLSNEFFEGSLASQGYSRVPGTTVAICPAKDVSGKYVTGLDENARDLEVLKALDPENYKKEIKSRVETRKALENITGYDLSPVSDYYKKVSENGGLRLGDEEVILNLDKPEDQITYLWIRQHPLVAPSYEAWQLGGANITPDMEFYLNNEGEEEKAKFKTRQKINKATVKLDTTPAPMRLKWAKLLGLRINDLSQEEEVYNKLDEYLKDTAKGNLKEFERVSELTANLVDVKVTIKDAFTYNVIRSAQGGAIMFGNDKIAVNTTALEDTLLDPAHSDMYANLKSSIKDKKVQLSVKV